LQHVFVETNWVYAYAAPAHHKVPAAIDLLRRAGAGELLLHLPSICVAEARRPIHENHQVTSDADRIRKFLLWAKNSARVAPDEEETTRRVLDKMEGLVKAELRKLDDVLNKLRTERGIEIFDLSQEMLLYCTELSYQHLSLKPFDQTILAAILIRARELRKKEGIEEFAFCELDADLKPWDKRGDLKEPLVTMYNKARIWVYGDFLLQEPQKSDEWRKTWE
jgi:hypothetical protein